MNRKLLLIATLVIGAGLWGGRLAWRAHQDLVTLEVHDIPLREVVKKLERQTWETIETHKDVDGRITLNVEDQPLPVVLSLIADQTGARWTAAYPLYTTRERLQTAYRVARGEMDIPPPGWTNWNARPNFASGRGTNNPTGPLGFGGGPGGFGDEASSDGAVSVDWKDKTALEAAAELRRFGRVKVVPEDGTLTRVFLTLNNLPIDNAVTKLARVLNRKWTKFYALENRRMPRPEGERTATANLPRPADEQRRERFEQIAAQPEFQARMESRMASGLKNSTPQQRTERDKRRQQMRRQTAAR